MTQLVFISLVLTLVTASTVIVADIPENNDNSKDEFQCDIQNAVKSDCATICDVNRCPVTEHYSRVCPKETCKPGCACSFNEKFAANGTCISTYNCPPFSCERQNEEYVACPSPACKDSCSARGCPSFGFILTVVECMPECRCKQGFSRKDGVCVPTGDC